MKWHHINTRRISLQMCLFWNDGFWKKEKYTYGFGIRKTLQYFDGKKTEYYVDAEEWKQYRKNQWDLLDQKKWVRTIPWEAQTFLEHQLERFSKSFPINLPTLTNDELLSLQRHVANEVSWTNSRTWMIYLINEVIEQKVRNELEKRGMGSMLLEKYMLNFCTPLEENDAMKERIALLHLKLEQPALTKDAFETKLSTHAKRFEHIPMFGFDHEPYMIEHFRKALAEMKDPVRELHELTAQMRGRKMKFDCALSSLKLDPTDPLFDLILMLKHTVFVRDYRDTLRQKMYLLDRYMYEEIGERLVITTEQATNLTNEEIASGLNNEDVYDFQALAKEREKGFLLIDVGGNIEIYSGDAAYKKAIAELGKKHIVDTSELRGAVASKGTAIGPAKIIITNQDLHKIEDGDIMIATMTRQDFVPAMKKSAAIVTDEGSITNHAAIVSREFGIPCLVGVQNATKVFSDGDVVKVDAEKGIIKKV